MLKKIFPIQQLIVLLLMIVLSPLTAQADGSYGDITGDQEVGLADVILSLQALAGADLSATVYKEGDVNGDGRIGIPEAVNGLRVIGGYPLTVTSLEDTSARNSGTLTLRAALEKAAPGQSIVFDPALNGGIIALSIVGEEHTVLKAEVMGMKMEPGGLVSYLMGYFDRDYGKSALYARKNVVIDASSLPSGITLTWAGGSRARVLAVYGNLTMNHVTITGGDSAAEDISTANPEDQPWTLARGGAIAVWGEARLVNCTLYGNHCSGDFGQSRDRGAFGGGLYANIVDLKNCIVSGNTVIGAGAAGGGVYCVGGAESNEQVTSTIDQSAITGNRISGLFTYGGGVYSDGGSIGRRNILKLTNTTIAQNQVEPAAGMSSFLLGMGYWRGGGFYMSNGFLHMNNCTVTQNEVYGVPRTDDLGKSNLAGGIAATIGNAHAVEDMVIGQSIVVGNTVHEVNTSGVSTASYGHDIFTGSLLHFKSRGYNRLGVVDFSQILVPVGEKGWESLSRRHYPKGGDQDGLTASDVLDTTSGVVYSDVILSAGVNASHPAALYYKPRGAALDQIPLSYSIYDLYAEYEIINGAVNDFLSIVLSRIEEKYGLPGMAANFTADFEAYLHSIDTDLETPGNQSYTDPSGIPILTLAGTQWFGPSETWPKEVSNYPYIQFWHRLDQALAAENIPGMGSEVLGDEAWRNLFSSGPLAENNQITMILWHKYSTVFLSPVDQLGTLRPVNVLGDIGAVEIP